VKFTQGAPTQGDGKCSLTTELTCDASITTIDPTKVVATKAQTTDNCLYTVAFAHAAGCPVGSDISDVVDKLD
jgi:hypothetical protein